MKGEHMELVMGIDNGGTVCKVSIYDMNGRELAQASRKIDMIYPSPGFTEKDMNILWQSNIEAIKEAIDKCGFKPHRIKAVAATGHGNGMFLIDREGNPVGNGIISTDSRAKSYVDQWYSDGTFEKINTKTLQSIWAAQPVALLRWFKENEPKTMDKVDSVLMCKDFIRYRLTGKAYAEITDYSGTNLVNILTGEYDETLLEAFGIEEYKDKLPPLKKSTDHCGSITTEVAELTGLAEGTPVLGGFFDIDACAIATGLTSSEDLSIIAGTWSINQFISEEPVGSQEIFMTSIYGIPGYWLVTEASPTSASNLEWFINNLMEDTSYEELNTMVNDLSPEDSNILFFPYLFGSNAGTEMSSAFLNLNGWHTKAHMLRAVYEGVVFGHKLHVSRLLKHRNPPRKARISGGASKSEVWVQMFADILEIPIEITDNEELGTLGAAIGAAVGVGFFSDFQEATNKMVRISKTVYPNPEKAVIYRKKYDKFLKSLEVLKSLAD